MHPSNPFGPRFRAAARMLWVLCAGIGVGYLFGFGTGKPAERADAALNRGLIQPELVPASAAGTLRPNAAAEAPGVSFRGVAQAALAVTAWISGNGVYGAGIVVDEHHVLTCLHVVDKMKAIEVSVAEGAAQPARIVDRDTRLDLAVLEVEKPHSGYARLAPAASVQMGDRAFAMGAPRKLSFSLSSGIVSYVGRPYSKLYYLQTDIPTNSGSSGGPILDTQGRVVAISSFILRDSQGLAFALPIDYAYQRFREHFRDRLAADRFPEWLAERAARGSTATAATHSASRRWAVR